MASKKSLVVVESPAKARTINKYLGSGYVVRASMGHVRDLPARKLGVDVEHGFKPTYEVLKDRVEAVAELQKAAKGIIDVYLATDPDREGEAIGWHVAEVLKDGRKFHRVTFREITKKAVLEAFENASSLDRNKIDAQQARRILDRIVGYQVSPLLWKKVRKGLSAGRVQSVTLRMIVDREREIQAFKAEEYWTIHAALKTPKGETFEAEVEKHQGKKLEIGNEKEADAVVEASKKSSWKVAEVDSRERKTAPPPPFITSTLQQEAARRLHFPVRKTMSVAQRLYEGEEVGGGERVGLITYMRTDSPRVSNEALDAVREFLGKKFKKDYMPAQPNVYKAKSAAQEAHEAIRPTDVFRTPESLAGKLKSDELRLYTLIWERFVASQMTPARFDMTKAYIAAGDYLYKAEGQVLRFDGFMKIYPPPREKEDVVLPPLEKGQALTLDKVEGKQHFTQPPARYTEAALVKALEASGIGRPSTYASIIGVIQSRDYVERAEGKFKPTELGCLVTDILVEQFPDLLDLGYTAKMEEELDKIEEGKVDWVASLKAFYKTFSAALGKAEKNLKKVVEETDEKCDKCGSAMIIRWGRFGKFLACGKYPECKNTREVGAPSSSGEGATEGGGEAAPPEKCQNCGKEMKLRTGRFGKFYACVGYPECKTTVPLSKTGAAAAPPETLDEKCPKCKNNLVRRTGRFGEFTSCSGYPKCKYIKPKTVGVKCPEEGCGGDLAEKSSKRGAFYSCTNYPKCKFAVNSMPVAETCPKCKRPLLLVKETQKEGKVKFCHEKKCGYRKATEASE